MPGTLKSHDKLRHFVDHVCARKGKIFRLNVKKMNKSCDPLLVLMFSHLPILKCLLGRSEPPIALFYVKYCSYRSDCFFYVVFFFFFREEEDNEEAEVTESKENSNPLIIDMGQTARIKQNKQTAWFKKVANLVNTA